ncbi:hypothetical protein JJQ72_18145 [Paenibacillus sp. F411]|uniref:Uncharacterized protein n=1 Tax=Paenibacillus algicola TaxID=2565926 RepID=A0A4V1G3H4_9BACL|nr:MULTISPECIES: hypothetical protein [Paenibacillus]MBO2945905.1 hypothetical protein [Paenibacillus sp. F411]QCT01204.1 hypothetical protein E6C60_0481 [Paenibacillus algicola]
MNIESEIQVRFPCRQCQDSIQVSFTQEQLAHVQCTQCGYDYTLMKPAIGEEILLDWEQEAAYQRLRAEKTEQDKLALMSLVIKVIELLTWRDEGSGHIRALETLRQWLLLNGVPKPLIELLDAKAPIPYEMIQREMSKPQSQV